jgi:hypothetical protein
LSDSTCLHLLFKQVLAFLGLQRHGIPIASAAIIATAIFTAPHSSKLVLDLVRADRTSRAVSHASRVRATSVAGIASVVAVKIL